MFGKYLNFLCAAMIATIVCASGTIVSAQTVPSTINSARLAQSVAAYNSASEITRGTVARAVKRNLRGIQANSIEDRVIVAQAQTIVANQALLEFRKDEGLSFAQRAVVTIAGIPTAQARSLQAKAHTAVAKAQLMQREPLQALKTAVAARRTYGVREGRDDGIWDELKLWERIAASSLLERDNVLGKTISIGSVEELSLAGKGAAACGESLPVFARDETVGTLPIYPVLSMLEDLQGGVALRLDLRPDGSVLRARTTAAFPRQSFGDATLTAVERWRYEVPADISASCLEDVGIYVVFALN